MSNNSQMVQDRAIYNGRPIESCIWSIERRHFHWPWTTPHDFQGNAILCHWISYKRLQIH